MRIGAVIRYQKFVFNIFKSYPLCCLFTQGVKEQTYTIVKTSIDLYKNVLFEQTWFLYPADVD